MRMAHLAWLVFSLPADPIGHGRVLPVSPPLMVLAVVLGLFALPVGFAKSSNNSAASTVQGEDED